MRVTQEGMVQGALARLQERITRLDEAGRRLSSGKTIQSASDDVSGMNRVLSLRARIRSREQEARNASDALTWVSVADSKLQTGNHRLLRVRELMVQAASSIQPDSRAAIAIELRQIQDELVSLANTRIDGRPLFAGTSSADAVTGPPWAYGGNSGAAAAVQRRVSEQDTVTVNVTAAEVFGFGGGSDLFAILDGVIADVESGDAAGVSQKLTDVDAGMNRLNQKLAQLGAVTNRIEAAMVRNSDDQLALKGELAQVEDVDLAQAIMDLQTQEVAYQATLSALGRVLQPSLVDFLR